MKIIKKGLLDKDGIRFECDFCKAEFLIEGRDDLTIYPEKDLTNADIVTAYTVICPMCGNVFQLGNIDCSDYTHMYSCLRKREDWVEKYMVTYTVKDYHEFWDPIEEIIGEEEE